MNVRYKFRKNEINYFIPYNYEQQGFTQRIFMNLKVSYFTETEKIY